MKQGIAWKLIFTFISYVILSYVQKLWDVYLL